MKAFEFDEHIARSPEDVFAVLSDPTTATAFLENITASTQITDGQIGVGTRFRETRLVGGTESSAELEVTVHEPHTQVGIAAESEGIEVEYLYRLAPEDGGTRLTWTCEVSASGLRKMMLPVIAAIMKKEDGDHLRRLKLHLEGG